MGTIIADLMDDFANRTGLTSNKASNRYLWTDAFAVCNFLDLYNTSGEEKYKNLAVRLVDQVHQILGKHREDDSRTGWLGNEAHPTKNGLRIGKTLPERDKGDPIDRRQEWDRDGQYFHYLTKWIHALYQMAQVTGRKTYLRFAKELAEATMAFVHNDQMYWKMSIDLSYPLVSSMGKHDPIDGYVTFLQINQKTGGLNNYIEKFEDIMQSVNLTTTDPLGLGGLLFDIYRLHQLGVDTDFTEKLIDATKMGLNSVQIKHKLAFRELGLAIGLAGAEKLDILANHWDLKSSIIEYWENHQDWNDHLNINQVMLATSLSPDGFLELQSKST